MFVTEKTFVGIPYTFTRVIDKSWPTFSHFSVHKWKLMKLMQYLTVFPSHLNNIFLKSFGLLKNVTRNCEILQYLAMVKVQKVNITVTYFIQLAFHLANVFWPLYHLANILSSDISLGQYLMQLTNIFLAKPKFS